MRRLVLFASGADTDVLDQVPEEERNFRILGSSVLLTTGLALVSGTVGGFVLLGEDAGVVPFAIGAIFALLVFAVDRIVVSLPVNPYRSEQLHAAAERASGAPSDRVGAVLDTSGWRNRSRQIVGTFLGLSLRFLLAIILSILIAELLVLGLFDEEIDVRVGAIQTELAQERTAQLASSFDEQLELLDEELSRLAGTMGPSVEEAQDELSVAREAVAECDADLADVAAAKAAEQGGREETYTIQGEEITTSGVVGTGPVFSALNEIEQDLRQRCARLRADVEAAQAALAAARGEVEQLEADQRATVEALEAQRADVVAQRSAAIADASAIAGESGGLLLRRQALEDLVTDEVPATVEVDADPDGCNDVLCEVAEFFYPGTPIGNFVGLVRAGLLLIDSFPVVAKVALSLRRRRPYDALVAAIEERHTADAVMSLRR